jgi:hypothetical protein
MSNLANSHPTRLLKLTRLRNSNRPRSLTQLRNLTRLRNSNRLRNPIRLRHHHHNLANIRIAKIGMTIRVAVSAFDSEPPYANTTADFCR